MNQVWDEDEWYFLCCSVGRSRRYHSAMAAFYRQAHNLIQVVVVVTGASAFVALLPTEQSNLWLPKILTAVVTVSTVFDLIFDLAKKADIHTELMRRFTSLAAKMAEWNCDEPSYRKAAVERLRIEEDEPPVKRLIDLRAENDERRARGSQRMIPLGYLQRTSILAYFYDFGMAALEKQNASARKNGETAQLRT